MLLILVDVLLVTKVSVLNMTQVYVLMGIKAHAQVETMVCVIM